MGKRRRNDDDGKKEITEAPASGRVLPVAELGSDFDGTPDDGATYLALASREAASLPFYTRVEPPASHAAAEEEASGTQAAEAGRERHPAQPRESWEVVNAAHFRAYKARVAAHWPPDPALACPYPPPPEAEDDDAWRAYIAGTADAGEDEEAAMNAAPAPREPLVSLLSGLDTDDTLALLGHFNAWLADAPLSALWGRWIFALLCVLDGRLDAGQQSQLRDLVRTLTACITARWEQALEADELTPVAWKEGFYGVQTVAPAPPTPSGATVNGTSGAAGAEGGEGEEKALVWTLGARWKNVRDAAPRSEEPKRPPDDESVDSVLARAWILISAVVAGWGQWDLVDEVNAQVGGLPRHQ